MESPKENLRLSLQILQWLYVRSGLKLNISNQKVAELNVSERLTEGIVKRAAYIRSPILNTGDCIYCQEYNRNNNTRYRERNR